MKRTAQFGKTLLACVVSAVLAASVLNSPFAQGGSSSGPESGVTAEGNSSEEEDVGPISTMEVVKPAVHTQAEIRDYYKAHPFNESLPDKRVKESDIVNGEIGELSQETTENALATLNFMRYIAGVNTVDVTDNLQRACQAAAALCAHNILKGVQAGHNPVDPGDVPEDLYKLGAAGAGSSNLVPGQGLGGVVIGSFVPDPGNVYTGLSHRRYCLNPSMGATGFGSAIEHVGDRSEGMRMMYATDESKGWSSIHAVSWPAPNMPVEYFRKVNAETHWSYTVHRGSYMKIDTSKLKVVLDHNGDTTTLTTNPKTDSGNWGWELDCNMGTVMFGPIKFRSGAREFKAGDRVKVKITGITDASGKAVPTSYDTVFFSMNGPDVWRIDYDLGARDAKAAVPSPSSYTEGTGAELSDPTRPGYTFGGWYADADLTEEVDGITARDSGDKTLHAKWIANPSEPDPDPVPIPDPVIPGEQTGGQSGEPGSTSSAESQAAAPESSEPESSSIQSDEPSSGGAAAGQESSKPATSGEKTDDGDKKASSAKGQKENRPAAKTERRLSDIKTATLPAGTEFSELRVRSSKTTRSAIGLSWQRVSGASRYVVYGGKCGKDNKYKKLGATKGTSFTKRALKRGSFYKYYVVAVGPGDRVLSVSKSVHVATAGAGEAANPRSIKLEGKARAGKLSLKRGKEVKVNAKVTGANGRVVKKHLGVRTRFESANPKVAMVSRTGKVKAIGKGKTSVWAYAQNGLTKRVTVSVK